MLLQNNKLFNEKVSDKLYKNLVSFFSEMHEQRRHAIKTEKNMNKASNFSKLSALTGVGITLGTVAMAIYNNPASPSEVFKASSDILTYGGISAVVALALSINLHTQSQRLHEEYLDYNDRPRMHDVLKFIGFEKQLVEDLKNIGIDVEYKNIGKKEHYDNLSNIDVLQTNSDAELKVKTKEFVKNLVEEYKQSSTSTTKNRKQTP